MKRWLVGVGLLALILAIGIAGMAFADEDAMKAELERLKARIAQLESEMGSAQGQLEKLEVGQKAAVAEAPSVPAAGILGAKGVQVNGFVETAWMHNFDYPESRTNTLRTFDTEANGFMINKAVLTVQKPVTDVEPYGFRTDLVFGEDAEIIGSAGLGSTTDEIDVKQAFITARAPLGEGLDLKIGKFVTLLGAEVIADIDSYNWNYSSSYLFGFAIPFTHTGILASYPIWPDLVSVTAGVVQGWDIVDDNNDAKTLLGQFVLTPEPIPGLTAYYNWILGPEQAGNDDANRIVHDIVAVYNPPDWPNAHFMFNLDYGSEEDNATIATSAGSDTSRDANWWGYALYGKYDWGELAWLDNAPSATAVRWEYFNDRDAVRTGFATAGAQVGAQRKLALWELTLTQEFKFWDKLITRLEYRHDEAKEKIYGRTENLKNRQDTMAVQLIYPF